MDRRQFVKQLGAVTGGVIASSSVLYAASSPETLSGSPFTVTFHEKYFLDYEMFQAQAKWMEEQEKKLMEFIDMVKENDYPAKPLEVTKKGNTPHVITMDGSHYIVPEFMFNAVKTLIKGYDRYSKR